MKKLSCLPLSGRSDIEFAGFSLGVEYGHAAGDAGDFLSRSFDQLGEQLSPVVGIPEIFPGKPDASGIDFELGIIENQQSGVTGAAVVEKTIPERDLLTPGKLIIEDHCAVEIFFKTAVFDVDRAAGSPQCRWSVNTQAAIIVAGRAAVADRDRGGFEKALHMQ